MIDWNGMKYLQQDISAKSLSFHQLKVSAWVHSSLVTSEWSCDSRIRDHVTAT